MHHIHTGYSQRFFSYTENDKACGDDQHFRSVFIGNLEAIIRNPRSQLVMDENRKSIYKITEVENQTTFNVYMKSGSENILVCFIYSHSTIDNTLLLGLFDISSFEKYLSNHA